MALTLGAMSNNIDTNRFTVSGAVRFAGGLRIPVEEVEEMDQYCEPDSKPYPSEGSGMNSSTYSKALWRVIVVDPELEEIVVDDLYFAKSEESAKMAAAISLSEITKTGTISVDDYDFIVRHLGLVREKK